MRRRGFLAALAALGLVPAAACARQAPRREVLAFHYGWFGRERGWGVSADGGRNHPNVPEGGLYDSLDPALIARQFEQAQGSGVTGFITSWAGRSDDITDQVLDALVAAAPQGFSVCAYLEQSGGSAEGLAERLTSLHDRHAASPRWLRHEGRPVLFVFDRVIQEIGLEGWRAGLAAYRAARPNGFFVVGPANTTDEIEARRGAFEALHIYSLTFVTDGWPWAAFSLLARRWMQRWVRAQGGLAVRTATVLPGFDDRRLDDRTGDRPITARRQGRTYRALWEAALAARPDWILIVSWNEWFEASEIEPSAENGQRELETTREMSGRFRAP